jgi:hypothetical protein
MYRCYDDEEGLVTQEDKEAYVKRRYGRIVRYKRGGSGQATRSAGKRGIVNQNAAQPTVPGSQDALKQNLGASEVNPTLPPMQQGGYEHCAAVGERRKRAVQLLRHIWRRLRANAVRERAVLGRDRTRDDSTRGQSMVEIDEDERSGT